MDFAVVGGDARFAYLTQMLRASGRDARAVRPAQCEVSGIPAAEAGELIWAKNVVLNWPLEGGDGILSTLSAGTKTFFCGPGFPEVVPEGIRVFNLWKDEQLLLENAWLTAEGAVCAAMNASRASLRDCECLVIGWGRIGRALTEILVGLNARVTVASRSEKGRNGAVERGAEGVSTYYLAEAVRGKQIILSTPPQRVLGDEELREVDKEAILIDLSSAPYGVDLEAAKQLGLRAWREPGLPGRYCPFSAAKALMKAIIRCEEAEK